MPHFLTNERGRLSAVSARYRSRNRRRTRTTRTCGRTNGPNLQVIISRRRSSSACTRRRARQATDGRTRTVEAENHKFPVFLPRGDASCYATITNDGGDLVHHHQAHVRTYDCHGDAGVALNVSARNLGQKSMRRQELQLLMRLAPAYCATWVSF